MTVNWPAFKKHTFRHRYPYLLIVLASLASGGAKRIVDIASGSIVDTMANDADGYLTWTSDKFRLMNVDRDQKYDQILATWYMGNFTDISTVDSSGKVDTLITYLIAGNAATAVTCTLTSDTGTLPAYLTAAYYDEGGAESGGTISIYGDSTAAVVGGVDSRRYGLYFDQIWISYNIMDSAMGSNDTGWYQITYLLRGIENQ